MDNFGRVERAAAAVLHGAAALPKPLTRLELQLLQEIRFALAAGNIGSLPALDRLRDVAGLPPDPRIDALLSDARERRMRGRHV